MEIVRKDRGGEEIHSKAQAEEIEIFTAKSRVRAQTLKEQGR
jgi:hypothetical protein